MTASERAGEGADSGTSPWRLPGTLIVVPLVVLAFGSHWTAERRVEPEMARFERPTDPGMDRSFATYLVPEGAQLEQGVLLAANDTLTFDVPPLSGAFELEVQAFYRDAYTLFASADGETFTRLWDVPAAGRRGMQIRHQAFERQPDAITRLRLTPQRSRGAGSDAEHRVSGLRVTYSGASVRHVWLIAIFWGAWLLAWLAGRSARTRWLGRSILGVWARIDSWLAIAVTLAVILRLTPEVLAVLGFAAALSVGIVLFCRYFKRSPLLTTGYAIFLGVLFLLFLPWALGRVAAARAGALFDFTIDHRMRPDGREINSDGIRFRGEAGDLRDEDFVVLLLGDSFTYGLELDYEQTYPYVLERLLQGGACSELVRVVNFGWASSSPLLSLRLLQQVGAAYRPDLVVYNLDMTDFADDLRYERELRDAGDLEVDHRVLVRATLEALSARFPALSAVPEAFVRMSRSARPAEAAVESRERFFVTAASLDETRPDIERGVIKHLEAIDAFAQDELGAPMALVVYPRAYQYSARESPRNWERNRYQTLGPFAREPFRYFEEAGPGLPYPVFSLLPDFESTESFPLFFEDDPHWNPSGARFVAERVAEKLTAAGLLPCSAPAGSL